MISIIIPYNRDRGYLRNAIESIESQSIQHEIIKVHADRPVSVNFNAGLKLAKGEFCKFVCEDDMMAPNGLRYLLKGIENYDWCYANAIQWEGGGSWIYKPDEHTLSANIIKNRIHGGTTLYKTELLREIGGMDETLWTGEEYDMHLKLWTLGYIPKYIDAEVYIHRLWSGQKSRVLRKSKPNERAEEIKRIQSLYSDKV